MAKNKKKKKSKKEIQGQRNKVRKINLPLVLSIVAILISLGQLIFTIPFVLKYFDKVEIQVKELGFSKHEKKNYIESSYSIENNGDNTAKNVELRLRILKGDKVNIFPKIFHLKHVDSSGYVVQDLFYTCDELVPSEQVKIKVISNFSDFLKINNIDTLYYDKAIERLKVNTGPFIWNVKHSLGKVEVIGPDFYGLKRK